MLPVSLGSRLMPDDPVSCLAKASVPVSSTHGVVMPSILVSDPSFM